MRTGVRSGLEYEMEMIERRLEKAEVARDNAMYPSQEEKAEERIERWEEQRDGLQEVIDALDTYQDTYGGRPGW